METVCRHTKKHKTISKIYVFGIDKYFEDVRQDEKHVPDLLEAIIQPTDPVKDELRQKLFKIDQFGSKIAKIRDPKIPKLHFSDVRKNPGFDQRSLRGTPFCNIWPR